MLFIFVMPNYTLGDIIGLLNLDIFKTLFDKKSSKMSRSTIFNHSCGFLRYLQKGMWDFFLEKLAKFQVLVTFY